MKTRDMTPERYIDWDQRRQKICEEDHSFDVYMLARRPLLERSVVADVSLQIRRHCPEGPSLIDPSLSPWAVY